MTEKIVNLLTIDICIVYHMSYEGRGDISFIVQGTISSSEASPTFGHANANLNDYHYSFL